MIEIFSYKVLLLPLIIGSFIAFFGWILYWVGLNVTGATLGGAFGVVIGVLLSILFQRNDLFIPLVIIFGIIGILFGIFFFRKVHILVFFLVGLALGILAGGPLLELLVKTNLLESHSGGIDLLVKGVCGAIGGLLTAYFNRYIISILTAAIGTLLMMNSWNFRGGLRLGALIFFCALMFQIVIVHKKGRFRKRPEILEK